MLSEHTRTGLMSLGYLGLLGFVWYVILTSDVPLLSGSMNVKILRFMYLGIMVSVTAITVPFCLLRIATWVSADTVKRKPEAEKEDRE